MVQKIYSKMYFVSCTHHDVTDLVNHGMVKNTKTWISWEQNIIFLWNKKILNLYLKWHILRKYHFVAEVTFKNQTWFFHEVKECESLLKCLSESVDFHIIGHLLYPKFVSVPQIFEKFCNFLQFSPFFHKNVSLF